MSRRKLGPNQHICGCLPIWKPPGVGSKDIARCIEKKFGKMKIGHVGTLDPDAAGVLPLLLGKATKFQDHLLEMPKTYEFSLFVGGASETFDLSGSEFSFDSTDAFQSLESQRIQEEMLSFLGRVEQLPPMYSAVKLDGKPLYKYARKLSSESLEEAKSKRKVRFVTVHDFKYLGLGEDLSLEGAPFKLKHLKFRVSCSKGTYVRVLGVDLAEKLGYLGVVSNISRVESSGFQKEDCRDLDEVLALDDLNAVVQPVNTLSLNMPVWRSLATGWSDRLKEGRPLRVREELFSFESPEIIRNESEKENSPWMFLDEHSHFLGIGSVCQKGSDRDRWLKIERRF